MGSEFWSGLLDWIKKVMLEKHSNISEKDLDLIQVFDDPDAAIEQINTFYKSMKLKPNFEY